ncbi:SusC/RagA family TonB-linked outer membrane protein [Chryseobacterium koreense]|uniref:TonB-dependent receptor n=1 Tax=Chryseobacterium koreense CCUG 49689 TaxID=1304281 RepID=A0A0J7IWQ1_9FLAO|nr:SusC/RagA family TonB-linked outer membrane protein [Chryseobacterium koreense]KMQ70224.1 TonB-dependent receptor [Chryseobacterium koreense CCUG 49689]MBB5334787.1 TonB-linked SusC/RagA family outer membrane protein [Chryseobacterium koreense]
MKKKFCRPAGITFAFLLSAVYCTVHAQTRTVTGIVNDGEQPLSGVTVSQEGSSVLATTTATGAFSLRITGKNPILVFSHPEYAERRIATDGKSIFTVALTEKVKSIEEVVLNAGYYKVKERESTGSIAKVTAKDIENQPVNNVLSAVQGRMAGVSITQNSGTPGGGFDVQIRGRNSLRNLLNSAIDGNQPLYIVDGIALGNTLSSAFSASILPLQNISPLNSLNPNDIESIEILKDADATAIYGSRGANGVILITTKKGKKSDLTVTIGQQYGLSAVTRYMKMMDNTQYVNMRLKAYANANITNIPASAYDVNGTWDKNRNTDWQKELIGHWAEHSDTQFSILGGDHQHSFRLSASHKDQGTVFPGDFHYKTNNLDTNYNFLSVDKKFELNLSNSFSQQSNNVVSADFNNRALLLSPNAPALYDSAGNINWENNTFSNPVAALNSTYTNHIFQFNQGINLSYNFLRDFKLKLNGGFNYQHLDEINIKPNTMYNPAFGSTSNDSSSSKSTNSIFTYIAEPQISWLKQFGVHELIALAGASFQQATTKISAMTGVGFASNALLENLAAANFKIISPEVDNQYKYASLFARINYNFSKKYIVNLTARRDGSSRFGMNNRFANFGAIGAAWLFSNEAFLKNIKWLSFGKLRGSYGITGSDFIGDYQYLNNYSIADIAYNNTTGLYPISLFNPNFSWEKTKKFEAAMEMGLFKDYVNFSAAFYLNRSSGQLVGMPLSATTGFASILANLDAVVENRGWEFEASSTPLRNENWRWQTSFNISFPENKLISFPDLEGSAYANKYLVGMPTSIVKLFNYEGIDRDGKYIFTDYNGDGKISSPTDAQAIRNIGVKYFGGWQNEVRYKNLNLSFLFQFVQQTNWNFFRTMTTPGNMNNQPVELLNVWSPENPAGIIMPYSPGTQPEVNTLTSNFRNSTAAVGDASYIRLKNIQLNYRFRPSFSWMRDAVVYVQGQNILTVTSYFGQDPEFITTGFVPPLKTYALGFQFKF